MRHHSRWFALFAAVSVFLMSSFAASALAAPKGKPPRTPPGVPPGQPFQALQKQIGALDVRIDALEATAPRGGLVWTNPLDLRAGTSVPSLDPAAPGLVVAASGAGTDIAEAGLQVPLGFVLTGVTVCYVSGAAGSSISSVQLLELGIPLTSPPSTSVLGSNGPGAAPPSSPACVSAATSGPVDPSAGGPVFLSLTITFNAAEAIVIRAIGLQLEPAAAP